MNNCEYKEDEVTKLRWTQKPLVRQLAVASSVWSLFFQQGLYYGTCPVLVAQLRREPLSDGTIIDDERASWISSAANFSGIPCVFLIGLMAEYFGRKPSILFVSVTSCTGFIVFCCTSTYTMLLLAQMLQGPLFGATICHLIASECISPKYRGICCTIQCATGYWAVWLANAVGTFFHWKNIGIIGIVCTIYNALIIIICYESPYWLASKGKIEKCREAHRWYRGKEESAEKDLKIMIRSEVVRSQKTGEDKYLYQRLLYYIKKISASEFYQPVCLCILLAIMFQLSGKLVLCVYAIDIVKKITGDESAAYMGMLILDGITVLGMYIGCVVSRYCKRRTLFFSTELVAICFLLILSLYLYLIKLGVIKENVYFSMFLLIAFSLSITCGPIILIFSLISELLPLELRTFAAISLSSVSAAAGSVSIKISPLVFSSLDTHGAFLYFAVGSLICTMILFKYLPETKDKTLEEIELFFSGKEKSKEMKELVRVDELVFAGNCDNPSAALKSS